MKRTSLIYSFNPRALHAAGRPETAVDITLKELARLGVPARKARRTLQELRTLAAADPALGDRKTLLALAVQIADQLP